MIQIFHESNKDDSIAMGNASFEIGSILGTRGNTKAKLLKNGGTVFVRVEKALGSGSLLLKMSAANLTKTEGEI